MGKGLPRSLARASKSAVRVKRVHLNAKAVDVSATGSAVGFGSVAIEALPEGNVLIIGAVGNLAFTNTDTDATTTFDGDWSLGTVATVDTDVADAGEANIISSTAMGAATARVGPVSRGSQASPAIIDNTDSSKSLQLNVLIDAAEITNDATASFTVSGDVWLAYCILGDD